jgi:glycerol-3-phosphate acyltransferase PlsY
MKSELNFILVLVLAYLIGSIPFGVIFANLFGLGDLRKIGSGNIGATNVLRTGRKGVAALTLLGDMLKGTFAVFLNARLFGADALMIASIMAVVGHIFPIWLKFKGGKGVATYLGVTLAISPPAALGFAAFWLITAAVLRYSSLAALVASAATPFLVAYMTDVRFGVVFFILTGLLFWKHSANIKRLMSGTETRIGSGNGKKPAN